MLRRAGAQCGVAVGQRAVLCAVAVHGRGQAHRTLSVHPARTHVPPNGRAVGDVPNLGLEPRIIMVRGHPRIDPRYAVHSRGKFGQKHGALRVGVFVDAAVRRHGAGVHGEVIPKRGTGRGHGKGAGEGGHVDPLRKPTAHVIPGGVRPKRGEVGAQAGGHAGRRSPPREEALREPRGPVRQRRGGRGAQVSDPAAGGGQHCQRRAAQPGFLLSNTEKKFFRFSFFFAPCVLATQ